MRYFSRLLVHFSSVVFLLFAFFGLSSRASAQNPAALDVAVFDPNAGAVTDATAVLQSASAPGDRHPGVASGDGHYRFDVPPGRYTLTITHAGLHSEERDVTLDAGARRELRVTLQLEPMSQTVLVSADALAITTAAASEPSTVITREEIDRRQTVHIAQLLATLPGITVAQADSAGGRSSVYLDGGNSNFAKVMVDGVPLNPPGGVVDFSNFTLDNIDKVEVVHGAQSALAGSDAMTGVIEILTHRGSTRAPQLLLESDGGSFSTGRGMARLSGLVGPLDYSAAAGYFSTRGRQPNDRFINRTLSGNFGLRVGEQGSLRLTLRNNTSDAGAPGQIAFTPPNLDQHNALRNFTSGLVWDGSSGPHWQHRVSATETYIRQVADNALVDFFTSPDPFGICFGTHSAAAVPSAFCDYTYHSQNVINRAGFQAQTSYVAGPGALTAGYVYEVENGFLSASSGGHARRNNQAGFLAGRWSVFGARVVVNAGFRVEDNDGFGTKVVPRAGIAFTARKGGDLFGATRLRFSYGQGIKEPRLDQSFGTNICDPGNPSLLPERSRSLDAGVEQSLDHDRVTVSADYFDNRFHDVVSFTSCFSGGPCPVAIPAGCSLFGTYFNTDLARARGTNIAADARVNSHLLIHGNYMLDDSLVLNAPNIFDLAQAPGNRLFYQPLHSGNIVLSGGLGRLAGSFTARFVGPRTDSDFLFLGFTSNPGYAAFNVAGSFRINAMATATLRVDNLSDKHYQEILGYPVLGRAAYVGMRFTFGGE